MSVVRTLPPTACSHVYVQRVSRNDAAAHSGDKQSSLADEAAVSAEDKGELRVPRVTWRISSVRQTDGPVRARRASVYPSRWHRNHAGSRSLFVEQHAVVVYTGTGLEPAAETGADAGDDA